MSSIGIERFGRFYLLWKHTVKLAIIGSGIAGLTAAHHLQRCYDVTLFEANNYPGGHTHTVDVALEGRQYAIDTGFIVFNNRTYPHFIRLLTELGVTSRSTKMSFSVTDERSGLEYNGGSLNGLFAQRRNLWRPRFYRILADILRFNRQARASSGNFMDNLSIGEFLSQFRYTREFAELYLLPMGAAIWSCPPGVFADYPVQFVIEFFRNHGLLDLWNRPTWQVIDGGSRTYVERLLARFQGQLRLNSPIERVRRSPDQIQIHVRGKPPESFDHVVFACHSDQALRILGSDATLTERKVLSAFPLKNVAVLHMPTPPFAVPAAWASWNYRIRREADAGSPST
ncbi:MAG: FAD-dependent oxidoreductase [Planctomycetaceae bacterium]